MEGEARAGDDARRLPASPPLPPVAAAADGLRIRLPGVEHREWLRVVASQGEWEERGEARAMAKEALDRRALRLEA